MITGLLLALVALALATIWYYRLDTDYGTYADTFRSPDKVEHAALSMVLVLLLTTAGVPALTALAATVAAGVLYEVAQKVRSPRDRASAPALTFMQMWHTSWRDVVCDVLGALLAYGWVWLWTR